MTHAELCDWLRHLPAYLSENGIRAADELERQESRINELLEFCEILRRERDAARTLMSGNVRLVEELEDGAIFEVGPGVRND